jgi:polyhydroxyalkanoate synthesis regulator phasin
MANKNSELFKTWMANAEQQVKSAGVKIAADQEALAMKDPNSIGTVAIPDCGDGSNREVQNLPTNSNNMEAPNKDHNIMDVTKPNGVGQGQYPVPVDGSAADRAVHSPTTPLSKLAQDLQGINAQLQNTATPAQEKHAAPADVQLPTSLVNDSTLMSKLASLGAIMMGSESGQRAVQAELEKRAGLEEARAIIAEAYTAIEKEAAAHAYNETIMTNEEFMMQKQAAIATQAHASWFNSFNTEMEKEAYAHGAEDGDAVADAVEAGADPEALADITDEEVIAYLQSLVESGQISQEEAEAVLQALGNSAQDGLTGEEMAAAIEQAVASGQITPEQGTAIAQQYIAQMQGGAEADAAAAVAEDPAVQEAAVEAAEKTAAVINHLWTPGMA